MTDPISTIRQALDTRTTLGARAYAALNALEAERLTPKEARKIIRLIDWREGRGADPDAEWVAKLERIAGGSE